MTAHACIGHEWEWALGGDVIIEVPRGSQDCSGCRMGAVFKVYRNKGVERRD